MFVFARVVFHSGGLLLSHLLSPHTLVLLSFAAAAVASKRRLAGCWAIVAVGKLVTTSDFLLVSKCYCGAGD